MGMTVASPGFYPVTIGESRYSGAYSGGRWVIMAGHPHPRRSAAFGSDPECHEFWGRVRSEGPVIEMDHPYFAHGVEVYVASGSDPGKLVEEMKEHLE